MNYKLFLGAGLVIISAAAAPVWFGSQIETQFKAQIKQAQDNNTLPPWASVITEKYDRSWLSSEATTSFIIDLEQVLPPEIISEQELPKSIELVFNHTIQHGPFITQPNIQLAMGSIESKLKVAQQYADTVSHYFGNQPPFQQSTVVALDGTSKATFSIPAYEGLSHDGLTAINWQGLTGSAKGRLEKLDGSGELLMPLINIERDNKHFKLKTLAFKGESRFTEAGLNLGGGMFSVAEINISGINQAGEKNSFQLQNFKIDVNSDQTGNLVNSTETISFEKAIINNGETNIGPGELQVDFRNLDAKTLVKLQDRLHEIENNTASPEQIGPALGIAMFETLPELLKYSPELEFSNAKLATDLGTLTGRLFINFNGEGDYDLKIPASLIPLLNIDVEASIPTALAQMVVQTQTRNKIHAALQQQDKIASPEDIEQYINDATQQQLAQLEEMGMIIRNGEQHTVHFNFQNGHATLNDQPADELMGMLPIPNQGHGF